MIGALAAAAVAAAGLGDWRPTPHEARRLAAGHVVVEMLPDPGRSSGVIHAAIDIPAPASRVWALVQDCADAPKVVTFLVGCQVIRRGPSGAWDVREDTIGVLFLPRLRVMLRTEATPMREFRFHCLPGGDLNACDGETTLETTPAGAVRVIYASAVSSPFPLPDLIIRTVLGAAVAQSLTNLRRAATGP